MRHTIHEFWSDDGYFCAVFCEGKLIELREEKKVTFEEIDILESPGVVKDLCLSLEKMLEIAEDYL